MKKCRILPIALLLAISLAACGRPATEVTRTPEPPPPPIPTPIVTPPLPSPTPYPPAASPTAAPPSPKPAPPKPGPSPSPAVDMAQMKRRVASDMREAHDVVTSFSGRAYPLRGSTPERVTANVTWKSAHHVEFSFAGEMYFFSLPADLVESAQKRVAAAYALTSDESAYSKTGSSPLSDEAIIRGVLTELQQALNDYSRQTIMSYLYEKGMSDTVKEWKTAPQTGRAITDQDKSSAVASLASWYARYRKELGEVVTRLNSIVSYGRAVSGRTVSG